jgi:ectoine hydroxylase
MSLASTPAEPHPSRTGGERVRILPRRDPVLHGPATGALTVRQRREWEERGFLVLTGAFAPEDVAGLRDEVERLRRDPQLRRRPERVAEPDSDETRSIFAVHRLSPLVHRAAQQPRLLAIAREILGGDVYLTQTRVNCKPALGGREFAWHSDFETWHVEDGMPRMRAMSVSIALTENTAANGPLMLIPGSHRRFVSCAGVTPAGHHERSLRRQELGVPDRAAIEALAREGGIELVTGPAGTATLFDCNVMHASASNLSPWPRTNLFFVYNSVANRLGRPADGLDPRPEHVAHRSGVEPLRPA